MNHFSLGLWTGFLVRTPSGGTMIPEMIARPHSHTQRGGRSRRLALSLLGGGAQPRGGALEAASVGELRPSELTSAGWSRISLLLSRRFCSLSSSRAPLQRRGFPAL